MLPTVKGGMSQAMCARYEQQHMWHYQSHKGMPCVTASREFVPFEDVYHKQALGVWESYYAHKKVIYKLLPPVDDRYWRAIVGWIECYDLLLKLGIDAEDTMRMSLLEGPSFNEEYTKAWKLGVRASLSPDYMEMEIDIDNSVPPCCLFPWVLPEPTDLLEYSFEPPLPIKGNIGELMDKMSRYVKPVSDPGDVDYASWHTNSVCYYKGQKTTVREARMHASYAPAWDFKFYRCPVQKDACETRDAVACDIHTLNSIKLLDQMTWEALKMPYDTMYRGDVAPIATRFYNKHRDHFFVMVDIKKCGLTFPHELLTALGDMMAEQSNHLFKLYGSFADASLVGYGQLKRGYCLGMASRAASAIIAGIFLMFQEEIGRELDAIFLNDDGVIATPSDPQLILELWGQYLEKWGIPVSWEKSFWSTKMVFCEEYRGMRWMKEGIYARAVANLTVKSVNWLHRMALGTTYMCIIHTRFGDALPDPLVRYLVDHTYGMLDKKIAHTGIHYIPGELGGLSIFPRQDWELLPIAEHSLEWCAHLCKFIELRDKFTDRLVPRKGHYAMYIPTEQVLIEGPFSLKMMLGNALYLPTDRHSSSWKLFNEWKKYTNEFEKVLFSKKNYDQRNFVELVRKVPALSIHKVGWSEVETFMNPYYKSGDMKDYFYAHRGHEDDRVRVTGNPLMYPTPVGKTLEDFNKALALLSVVADDPGTILVEMCGDGLWPEFLLLDPSERVWKREPVQTDYIPIQWGPWTFRGECTGLSWEHTMALHIPNDAGQQFAAVRTLFPYIRLREDEIEDIDDENTYYSGAIKNPRPYMRMVDGEKVSKVDNFTPLPYFSTLLEKWYVREDDLRGVIPFESTYTTYVHSLHDMYDYMLSITGKERENLPFTGAEHRELVDHYKDIEADYSDLMIMADEFKRMISEDEAHAVLEEVVPVGLTLQTNAIFEELGLDIVQETQQDLLYALMNCGEIEDDNYYSTSADAEVLSTASDLQVQVRWESTSTTTEETSGTDASSWAFEGG